METISLKTKEKKSYIGLLYISPWIIGFLVFQLYPLISSFIYSLTNFDMVGSPDFVGFKNYLYIFNKDDNFITSVCVTIKYVLISVPAKLGFALLVAVILNAKIKFINFFRTVYYLPSILGGSIAVSVIWRFLFAKNGVINEVLSVLSISPVDWLGSPKVALFTISLLSVWQFGSSMVLFLAGLKQVPNELYEACTVDGASKPRIFFTITLPLITPILFFNLVMQTVNAFQEFTGAFVITNGGPMKSTYLYAMKLYEEAFKYFKMGYASALSWVLFIVLIALTALIFKSSNYWTYYEDGVDK